MKKAFLANVPGPGGDLRELHDDERLGKAS